MKAQIKAIVASAVVIALCLAAVGGVTYSWFSDSEQSTIEVETAKVAIETNYRESSHSGTVSTSITTANGIDRIEISKLSANCTSTITGTIANNSTINVKYKVDATINYPASSPLTPYDKANIFINDVSLEQIGDSTNIVPWTGLNDNTRTFSVKIKTPETYGGMPGESIYYNNNGEVVSPETSGAILWEPKEPREFSIELKVIAVQEDYGYAVISEDVKNNSLNSGSASIIETPGASGVPTFDPNFTENNVSNVTVELKGLSNPSTLTIASKQSATTSTFSLKSNGEILAIIDLNAESATFTSAQVVVDLKGKITNPTVIYDGNGAGTQPTDISSEYVDKNGNTYTRIYFTTTHFSEYIILDKDTTLSVSSEEQIRFALLNGIDAKLTNDIEIENMLVASGISCLDMNGHKLSNLNDENGIWVDTEEVDAWSLISIRGSGSELTITGNGTFEAKENDCYAVDIQDGAKCIIENGTFVGNIHAVYAYEGTAYINGGSYSIQQTYPETGKEYEFTLNCYDQNRKTGAAKIIVTGGLFSNFNPENCKAEGTNTNFVAKNYYSVSVGDNTYKVLSGYQILLNDLEGYEGKDITVEIPSNGSINLKNGIANGSNNSRNITFIGDGTQTVDVITKTVSAEGGQLSYQRGSTFTFENLTIKAGEGNFDGIVCDELIFKNCTITGKLTLYGKATFTECTFENNMENQYSIWTWGGTDVTFKDCTFNTNGKAILLYGKATPQNPTNLIVNNCTFNDRNDGVAGKAAIEIGNDYNATYKLTINGMAVNGFADGKNTGSKLWANKNSMDAAHLTVTINGVQQSL